MAMVLVIFCVAVIKYLTRHLVRKDLLQLRNTVAGSPLCRGDMVIEVVLSIAARAGGRTSSNHS